MIRILLATIAKMQAIIKILITRKMNNIFIIFSILILISFRTYGQSESDMPKEHHLQHHEILVLSGIGFIPQSISEDGKKQVIAIPIVAFDYGYWFNHKIGLGLVNDLELFSYVVEKEEDEHIDRDYAFSTALVFLYEPIEGWKLFAGPGYEFEKNESFVLFKIGTELSKNFQDGWSAGIAFVYDIKETNSFFSLGLTIGKRFGK